MSTGVKREKEKTQQIQVFVRARPLNKYELDIRSAIAIDFSNKEISVKQQYGKKYTFDKIFGPNVKQLDVYTSVVKPLIPEVIAGYNCTVFAYGQTGTGKTHTMAGGSVASSCGTGVSWQNDQDAGIIPRSLAHLFDELCLVPQYTVRVSYLELYNEELYDLLSDNVENKSIRLFEDQHQKGSVIINGITKETVYNKYEVYDILQKGQERRRTASTLINANSSRSHTVFTIMVHTTETTVDGEELVKTGKLNLVDLAGSENISRSGAVDKRAREAGNINQSLLTLGRVIKALVEKTAHIPYRESKLTRILQDSLGGRTKTSIIATISPAISALEETLSTLDYAHRARNITNRPEINERLSQKAWKLQYEKEMDRLRKDLLAARTGSGIFIDQDNYERLVADCEGRKEELIEKVAVVRELEQHLMDLEQQKDFIEGEMKAIKTSMKATQAQLSLYRAVLKKTVAEKKEQEHLALCYESKAGTLHNQAQMLLGMTKKTAINLQKKIDTLRGVNHSNDEYTRTVAETVMNICSDVAEKLLFVLTNFQDTDAYVGNLVKSMQVQQNANYKNSQECSRIIIEETQGIVNATCQNLKMAYSTDKTLQNTFFVDLQNKLLQAQDATDWLEMKVNIDKMRHDVLGNLNKSTKTLMDQQENTNAASEEIDAIVVRLNNLKKIMSDSKTLNQNCLDDISTAKSIIIENMGAIPSQISLGIDKQSQRVSEAMTIVNDAQNLEYAMSEVVEQLERCQSNFVNKNFVDDARPTSDVEAHVYNLQKVVKKSTEVNEKFSFDFMDSSKELHGNISQMSNTISEQYSVVGNKMKDCRTKLDDLMTRQLIKSSTGDTPLRLQFDTSALTEPSPKQRILTRFRTSRLNEIFNQSVELEQELELFEEENRTEVDPDILGTPLSEESPNCDNIIKTNSVAGFKNVDLTKIGKENR